MIRDLSPKLLVLAGLVLPAPLAALHAADPPALRAAEAKPALWAVYYAWYETGTGPHGRWRMWSDDAGTAPNPQPKSKAQPLIGYYDSDDPKVVRWHIQLAKAAGIDAFLVSWWGGANISGTAFEKTILPIATDEKFKVALCSELAQFHHDVQVLARQTSDVLRKTKDSPAYLRMDGKPVVYLYQVPFAPKLTPETFGQLCRGVEAEVGPVYWMMDKVTNAGNRGLSFPRRVAENPGDSPVRFLRDLQHQARLEVRGPRARLRPLGPAGPRGRQESLPARASRSRQQRLPAQRLLRHPAR